MYSICTMYSFSHADCTYPFLSTAVLIFILSFKDNSSSQVWPPPLQQTHTCRPTQTRLHASLINFVAFLFSYDRAYMASFQNWSGQCFSILSLTIYYKSALYIIELSFFSGNIQFITGVFFFFCKYHWKKAWPENFDVNSQSNCDWRLTLQTCGV